MQICQSCRKEFELLPGDAEFYGQLKVAPPTFCFHCRLQRRMTWRNERSLYKRTCDAPGHGEEIISMYPPGAPYTVYDRDYWWSDGWDPVAYGKDYDFDQPFFRQFSELLKQVPLPNLSLINSVNSDYSNFTDGNKNCYLVFGAGWNENVNYGNKIAGNRDSQDLLNDTKCELSYECVNCVECYRLFYSANSKNCSDSYFLYNCRNCQDCFGCVNLVKKSFCIFNEQYTKEEYKKKLEEMGVGSRAKIAELREKVRQGLYLRSIHRYANIFNSTEVTGDNINNSKNCKMSFDLWQNAEDSNYLYGSLDLKNCYDCNGGFQNEYSYEMVDCNVGTRNMAGVIIYSSNDVAYAVNCHSSSDLFGCIGLRGRQYCILNKQYTKEEYEALVPKIIAHMGSMQYQDRKGRKYAYGDFFPIELSPHAYNETLAQEYFTLTKDDADAAGFPWREETEKHHAATLLSKDVPDTIARTDDSVLEQVIACAHEGRCREQCTSAFKLIPGELQFYKKLNIPIPVLCPNCRHYARLREQNPMELWRRTCQCEGAGSPNAAYKNTAAHFHGEKICPNAFETNYAPNRPEIVYCEACYQSEVA